ncbi:6-bladed beta-propeller [Maribellus maritimus]|uniref:6-bladed beta-propeller n=1 Tax=Maribellus maritimus TaxID=2870838 RepID=UPI001EE9FD00|nr:6-bladed beta-propeller [Maribellus maritimus]MCG6189365.1 6-bladed beta-propeller [Maribellus maritimus]
MKNLIPFLSIFILLGCNSKVKTPQENQEKAFSGKASEKREVLQIDPRKFENKELSLADFAADIKYIPLSNKLQIGSVQVLRLTANAVYIIYNSSGGGEGNGHPQLFRFDKNGKNPVEIGSVGRGPREYLSGNYFAVDEPGNRIYISGKINTVLVFDTLGNYVRQFKFQNPDQRFAQLEYLDKNKLFVPAQKRGAGGPYLWSIIDTLGNIVSSKNNSTPPFETRLGPRSGTFIFQDKISYWVDYNDTIFQIAPDFSYRASYIITPGEHKVTHQDLPFSPDLPEKLLEFYSPHVFWETNKYLISRYNFKGKFAYVFIDKNTHNTSVSSFEWERRKRGGIPNNFDGGMDFSPETCFTDNGKEYLAGYIQPYELKIYVASDEFKMTTPKFPDKKKELEQLANSLDENDNPVLMLVKLKE